MTCGRVGEESFKRTDTVGELLDGSKPPACCGSASPLVTRAACSTRTFGRPTPRCCPRSSTGRRAKARARPVMWSASTTCCASGLDVLCGGRFRSPKTTRCTTNDEMHDKRRDARQLSAPVPARTQSTDQASTQKTQTYLSHYLRFYYHNVILLYDNNTNKFYCMSYCIVTRNKPI